MEEHDFPVSLAGHAGCATPIAITGEVIGMQIETWARKALTKDTLWLVFRVLSPFLVWGFLLFWVYMALQHP